MKLSRTLWTKLLAVGLGATMALGVGLTISRVVTNEIKAADVTTIVTLPKAASDSSTAFTTSTIHSGTNSLNNATNGSFISSSQTVDRVYAGQQGFKFGSSSARGLWSFTTTEIVTKIKVNFTRYSTNTTPIKITSIDDSKTTTGSVNTTNISFEISSCSSDQFTIESTGSAWRMYVSSIEFTYDDGLSGVPVTGVQLNKSLSSLYVGGTEQLTATVLPIDASNKAVSWESSNNSVATVSGTGLVTAVGAGSTVITVTTDDGGKTATCNYTVTAVVLNTISIKTAASKTQFTLGETFNHSGLVINANYNSGTVEVASGFTVTGIDTDVLGAQTAVVSYEGKTTSYSIDVTNNGASVGESVLASNLFISEYVEGSSGTNKALEIFNGTGTSVDLSNYSLKIGTNGAALGNELVLSGSLANGAVYVIYNSGSIYADITANGDLINNTIANFNGDDAVGLFNSGTLIDVIGTPGNDPGSYWSGTAAGGDQTGQTADRSLRRANSVTSPNTTFTWSEWNAYLDTDSDLSKHDYASADVTALEQATAFANYVMTGIGNNASGNCVAVKSELDTEYGYMHADAKTVFNSNSGSLFVNARARMVYLTNWAAAQSPTGVQTSPNNSKSILMAITLIGFVGLTATAGLYFLRKKKETF